jgi:hypothetical protein
MHKYFADWYRAAALEPKAEDLEKRWQAIESFAKKIKVQNALDLVRLFYARPTHSADFIDKYSAAFQTADPTFQMRDNALELQLLSGAAIAHIIETTRTYVTDAVAFAMLCGFCQGLRQRVLNGEIVESAHAYLANKSVNVRAGSGSFEVKPPDIDLEVLLDTLTGAATGSSLATLKEPISPPFEKLATAISDLTSSINKMAIKVAEEIKVRREESDILWWVFGEHSRDLSKRMAELPLPFATLVAGKELADLVRVIPGPLAAQAYLDKMLRFVDADLSNSTSIKDAVNTASREWREKLIEERKAGAVEGLCPIHLAVEKSLDFDKPAGWPTQFDKSTELKSKAAIAPLALATQIYHEKMLMSAVRAASSN